MKSMEEKQYRVGIRFPDWSNGYIFRLFEGLQDFQRREVPFQLVFDQPSGGDLAPRPIDAGWDGDGLIVLRHTEEEARAWAARGVAVVNLSVERPDGGPIFPRVTVDNELLGRQAAEHLALLGLRDFCYIHEATRRYSKIRLKAFREAVEQVGGRFFQIDVPISAYPAAERPQRIEAAIWKSLAGLPRPCGIFTKDDIAAVWTIETLAKIGIRCPEEMPVLGVSDDLVFCHMTNPAISSLAYPGRKVGYEAAKLLYQMLRGEAGRREDVRDVRVPSPGVVIRESTRRVVLDDPVVTRSMEFIREMSPRRFLPVAELAAHCGVSRELLRLRFRDTLGRTPRQEIERIRLRRLMDLMTGTNWKLERVAEACGFSGSDEVCRYLKKHTGRTSKEIRRER